MSQKMKVIRFSVSLPPSLVEDVDEIKEAMQYGSRSKFIHDAVQSFITEVKWMREETERITGAILVLYYLEKPHLLEEVMHIQHQFKKLISSTMHIHLESNKCLEIIAVEGEVRELKKLTQALMTKKGVKQVKVATIKS